MVDDFTAATTVERADDGRFTGDLGDRFSIGGRPQGGVAMAFGLRAIEQAIDNPGLRLRTATAVFAAPLDEGAAEAAVTVLRRGRSTAQATVHVSPPGSGTAIHVSAVYAADRAGFDLSRLPLPTVPAPSQCPSLIEPPDDTRVRPPVWVEQASFWQHVERRTARGHSWWETDWEPTDPEGALWVRFRDTPRNEDGAVDPLGLVVLTDMLPQAVTEGMGSTATFGVLSADHTVHLFGGTDSEWLLLGIRAHHAGDGFTSLEGTLWDETGNPLARVNQVAVLAVDH